MWSIAISETGGGFALTLLCPLYIRKILNFMFYENLRVLKEIQKNIKRSKLPLIQNIFTVMAAHQLTQTATWLLVDRFLAILGTIIKIQILHSYNEMPIHKWFHERSRGCSWINIHQKFYLVDLNIHILYICTGANIIVHNTISIYECS